MNPTIPANAPITAPPREAQPELLHRKSFMHSSRSDCVNVRGRLSIMTTPEREVTVFVEESDDDNGMYPSNRVAEYPVEASPVRGRSAKEVTGTAIEIAKVAIWKNLSLFLT